MWLLTRHMAEPECFQLNKPHGNAFLIFLLGFTYIGFSLGCGVQETWGPKHTPMRSHLRNQDWTQA